MLVRDDRRLSKLGPQCLDFGLQRFILRHFAPQKLRSQLGLFSHPRRRQQVGITQLVLALAEVLHLHQALSHKSLEAEIDRTKPHTQILGQRTLTYLGRPMQTAQHFELDFLLETSHFLKWGYEAQGDLGTLPPYCFTISKRGQTALRDRPE